jgi:ketosteroid isomerase-like protein
VSQNLDLVRSIYAAWERGDFSSADWADREIEFVSAGGPDPGTVTGVAAAARAWRDFLSVWEDYSVAAEAYREFDDGRVLVFARIVGRGKASGLDVGHTQMQGANLFSVADGVVTRLVLYWDRNRALADLGVEE